MTPDQLHTIPANQLRDIARNMIIDSAEDIERLSIHENLRHNLGIEDPDGAYAKQIGTLLGNAIITVTWPTEPRTWDLPAEPGPEVLAVADATGVQFDRDEHMWRARQGLNVATGGLWTWRELLIHRPGPIAELLSSPAGTGEGQ